MPRSGGSGETHGWLSRCSCEGACMANDEVLNRAAEVNEQFRTIELTAETVTRPAGPHTPTVHHFLRHLRAKGLDCVPEPLGSWTASSTCASSTVRTAARAGTTSTPTRGSRPPPGSCGASTTPVRTGSHRPTPSGARPRRGRRPGLLPRRPRAVELHLARQRGRRAHRLGLPPPRPAAERRGVRAALVRTAAFRRARPGLAPLPGGPGPRARVRTFVEAYGDLPPSTSPTPSSPASATPASTSGSSPTKDRNLRGHGSPRAASRGRNLPTSRGSRRTGRCFPTDDQCTSTWNAVHAWSPPMKHLDLPQ